MKKLDALSRTPSSSRNLSSSLYIPSISSLINLAALSGALFFLASCGVQRSSTPLSTSPNSMKTHAGSAIVGELDWSSVEDIKNDSPAWDNARFVGLISVPALKSRCTAFLISPNVVMTNWHCFPDAHGAKGARFYPEYYRGENKTDYDQTLSYQCDTLLSSSERYDVALLLCQDNPGLRHGVARIEDSQETIFSTRDIYVIHQNCDYNFAETQNCAPTKKYSPGEVMLADPSSNQAARAMDLFYNADTLGGSSGSPVFSAHDHKVIALHHNGHGKTASGRGRGTQNSGIPMHLILNHIKQALPQLQIGFDADPYVHIAQDTPADLQDFLEQESNDDAASANTLPLKVRVKGEISHSQDIDIFKINVSGQQKIRIALDFLQRQGDLELKIFNSRGELIAKSTTTLDSEVIEGTIGEGRYYILVYGYQNALAPYKLTIE